MDPGHRNRRIEVRHGVSGVVALILTVVALPPLAARWMGGRPPSPGPQLAALAPAAAPPAVAAVVVAAATSWRLALLLALPAVPLVAWQLPPFRRAGPGASHKRGQASHRGQGAFTLRVLTLNALGDSADPAAVLSNLRRHQVDVLAVQELTPHMVRLLTDAGVDNLLPFCHLDPRPGSPGMGLWARWPLIPLPPVPGLAVTAPRARIEPVPGSPVTVSDVHPLAPTRGHGDEWRRDLALIRSVLDASEPQVVAGDFNAGRDHGPFRALLAAGFLDCADAALSRPWPGFTWPVWSVIPPVIRLDHVLVSRAGATVLEARVIRVPGTDHRGVFAVIEFRPAA
jgi:endonuclease/exonuclease/phosphatase (EEP) superfamily protein YafD